MSEIKLPQYGALAMAYCKMRLPLQVCRSGAGFYIGTCSETEGPISRESNEHWETEAGAEDALRTGEWSQKPNP